MEKVLSVSLIVLLSFLVEVQSAHCAPKSGNLDPCSLVSVEEMIAIFPTLQKSEKQSVGPETVCNYLDKMEIPALIVSVSKAGSNVRETLSMLGSGYVIEDIPGLGDEAAIAIQQPNPKFGLKEGIAALHVKKGAASLNFSFFRINLKPGDAEFDKIRALAAEMISKL